MEDQVLDFFADYIRRETGINYAEFNRFQLKNRLNEIQKFYSLASMGELYEKAKKGLIGEFRQLVLDVATNNETFFFRDPEVFTVLENSLLPEILDRKTNLKIWSAACSTGQEPYTIAMILNKILKEKKGGQASILASDISERALKRAKSGTYSQLEVQRGLSVFNLMSNFKKLDENNWEVKPELRQMISFKNLNLLGDFNGTEKYDFIFCRNVLIYQNVENKKLIIKKLTEKLVAGGYLILGGGESLLGLSQEFENVQKGSVIVYRKKIAVSPAA